MLCICLPPVVNRWFAILAFTFILLPAVWTQSKFKVLYNFKGGTDWGALDNALVFDQEGNLYGTAGGGPHNENCGGTCGRVFELTPHANGKWTETVLHDFKYSDTDGYWPFGGVTLDPDGNLYGTTSLGGAYNDGTVFELTPSAGGKWTETILYNFGTNKNDIGAPGAALLLDGAGDFFSTAGEPYELSPGAGGQWHEHVLYRFHPHTGKNGTDGSGSNVPVIFDPVGNLYGTTEFGGNYPPICSGGIGCGTVFELTRQPDGKWKEHVLHRFAQFENDGQLPMAGLVMDSSGNVYGTTYEGGKYQNGTVFELSPEADGRWKESILYEFPISGHVGNPSDGLVLGATGSLYGTANGGSGSCDWGAVYKLTPGSDGAWAFSILHEFCVTDGQFPQTLSQDKDGNLYGTTQSGGTGGYGVVFEITP